MTVQGFVKFLITWYSSTPPFISNLYFLPENCHHSSFSPLEIPLNSLNIKGRMILSPLSLFSNLYSSPRHWYSLPLFITWYSSPTDLITPLITLFRICTAVLAVTVLLQSRFGSSLLVKFRKLLLAAGALMPLVIVGILLLVVIIETEAHGPKVDPNFQYGESQVGSFSA